MDAPLRPFWWEDDALWYIDQRHLPVDLVHARASDAGAVIDAITTTALTGPRSIAIFAAFGVVLARRELDSRRAIERLRAAARTYAFSTAAIERVDAAQPGAEAAQALAVLAENDRLDRSIANHARTLLPPGSTVLTHGGTGALSTAGCGTAAGAIIAAQHCGAPQHVYIAEGRPTLTGSRLVAYELAAAGVACTVIPDGAVAALMQTAPPAAIIVGAVAMAANGDAIGELGTYAVAVAAAHHRIPLYVTLPRASIERSIARGAGLPLFERLSADAQPPLNTRATPRDGLGSGGYFDLTPGHLISAIVTEYGVSRPPYDESLPTLASRPNFAFIRSAS